jgi:hypothetical protein
LGNLKEIIYKNLRLSLESKEIPGWYVCSVNTTGGDLNQDWSNVVLTSPPSKPILFYKPRAADQWLALMRLEDINPSYCLHNESVVVSFHTAMIIMREDIWRCEPIRRH